MVGIIGALDVEIEVIKESILNIEEFVYGNRCFYKGTINKKQVVLVKSLVGKVNASMTTVLLLEKFDIKYIINIGVAGGIKPLKPFDLVIADKLIYHDFDATMFGYKKGQVPEFPKEFVMDEELVKKAKKVATQNNVDNEVGKIATGDIFMTKDDLKTDSVIAVEMEGAAVAQVCYIYNKPMIALRVVSDILGVENQIDNFLKVKEVAAKYACLFVLGFLE